jgi:arsenate reductase
MKILFLCTGNSCRSQMAEGWARHLHASRLDAFSAGTAPGSLDPRAVAAMKEAGVDISGHEPKHLDELTGIEFDWVVTVCDHAGERCPLFPGATRRLHAGFDDPPQLAKNEWTEEGALAHYRRVRDEIREFVARLPERLREPGSPGRDRRGAGGPG